jgi:RNA polymerase primary sigma factor
MPQSVTSNLEVLPSRERRVLKLRFGMGGGKPKTLREAGAILGISRERVRQIENRALMRLRHPSIMMDSREEARM